MIFHGFYMILWKLILKKLQIIYEILRLINFINSNRKAASIDNKSVFF